MDLTMLVPYVAIPLTVVGFGLFVFLLFPVRKPAAEAVDSDAPQVQRSTLAASFVSAAPRGYIGWLEKQIIFAGRPIGWSVSKLVLWKVVLLVVGVLGGWWFVTAGGVAPWKIVLAMFVCVLLFFLPDALINSRAHDRQEALKLALPDTLDQMTIAVEAGLGFDGAMAKAARNGTGPLAEELIRVLQDMSIGRTRREAFLELERRTRAEDLRRFVRAILQADAYGVAVGDVLRVQAGEMRLKRRMRAEEQAMKVTVKIIFPLVLCLLPALFIVVMTPAILGTIDAFN